MCNVNIATGELLRYQVDLFLPGYIPIEIARIYKSGSRATGMLGRGWNVNLLMTLREEERELVLVDEDGVETRLALAPDRASFANREAGITVVRGGDELVLDRRDGRRYRFPVRTHGAGLRRVVAVEDQHGNRITFHYGLDGLPTSLTDTLQRRLQFRFDFAGRLTEVSLATETSAPGEAAVQVRYAYDGVGNLVSVEDAAGAVRQFEYLDGLLVREIDRTGRSTFWTYDDKRRCVRTWRDGGILYRKLEFDDSAMQVKITDALGYVTVFELDERGNVLRRTDPLGQMEEKTYDANGNVLVSSGGRAPTRLTLWDRDAKCLTEASSDGSVKKYHFDAQDRLVRTELDDGEEWRQEYDAQGNIVQLAGPGGMRWAMEYAPEGFVSRMTNSLGHSVYQRRSARDRVRELGDDVGPIYRAEYNVLGSLIAVTDSVGNTTRCVVDKLGRVTEIRDPEGGVRRCRYDSSGRVLEVVDETGSSTRYEYGAGEQPLRQIDALGQVLAFEYDLEQQLIGVVDRTGHRLAIAHDPLGRVSRVTGFDGRVATQTHIAGDDAVICRDAEGTAVEIEGPRRTPTRRRYPDGSQTTYEWSGEILRAAEGLGGSISREFDSSGRLVREVQDGWALSVSFDLRNNLIGVSEEDGRSVQYDYDARRRVTAIRDSHFGDFVLAYDSRDLLVELTYPNGFAKRLAYDRCNRMISTRLQDPQGRVLLERSFEYDRATRLIAETVARSDGGPSYARRFEYDALGRLTTVLRDGELEEWYRYDAADNIRACHLFADSEVEAGNRMVRVGSTRFDLDARGNRVARHDTGVDTLYEYDAEGHLRRMDHGDGRSTSYRYDPVGRRVEKTRDGASTRFHWLVDTIFKESTGAGESHYLFLPTTFFPIAVSRGGERMFVVFDQIASPRELLSTDGRLVWSRDASAFGVDRVPPEDEDGADRGCPIRFQGQYRDAESGMDYNYHRYYDPLSARYLTPDPLGIHAGPNQYRYVPEPLTWIDPYGLFTANVIPRCDWNQDQMKDFNDKVDRYNTEIQKRQDREPPEPGIIISPCERSSTSASEAYKKCNDLNGKKKEGSPDGKGKPTDCRDDIDHMVDKQMGGKDNCDNYVPVNASVNRSLGSQMKRELAGREGQALTLVVAGTKEHCDDTTERTPACK